MQPRSCPRCGATVLAPGLWSSAWRCEAHGEVAPFTAHPGATCPVLDTVARRSRVPVWGASPAPRGWCLGGVAEAGDDRTGAVAVATAWCGPSPVGGPAELLLVTEEPGVGLGSRYAGLPHTDPGPPSGRADGYALVAGHETPLWHVAAAPPDRAVYVGEASGLWLWVVLWPETAGVLLVEHLSLVDLREQVPLELPVGAPSLHLAAAPG